MKQKTALVLGADSPVGRSVALQLSREGARVVLAGHDARRLQLLAELIQAKGGDPWVSVLSPDADRNMAVLADARDGTGNHYHFVINAIAACTSPADAPGLAADQARAVAALVQRLVEGRGQVRLLTVWPAESGDPVAYPDSLWHSVVRAVHLETSHDEAEPGDDARMVKAAGAADAIVYLLSCPPSACPVDVQLAPRATKGK